ncbi:unnamed protein product [Coffea canephora]|uniref:DH200=94 genomic scaffold, scaffold_339 n=1 Tax=Coffea canephora TaxID=49390 RepID=A0A068VEN6_COFCA|nr:unnamed protein product [Coffea canephora]
MPHLPTCVCGMKTPVGENSGKILHSGLWQGVPRESRGTITDATFPCDGIYIFASLEDGSIFILTSVELEPWCQINPTAYLPSNPSTRLHPLAIDAHPSESNQFVVGLTDGGVCIVEPPHVLVLWMWHAAFKR